MWNLSEAPLKITDTPTLGDSLFALEGGHAIVESVALVEEEPMPDFRLDVAILRICAAESRIRQLEEHVRDLQQRTFSARWQRLLLRLRRWVQWN